jgi:hypothetical protein
MNVDHLLVVDIHGKGYRIRQVTVAALADAGRWFATKLLLAEVYFKNSSPLTMSVQRADAFELIL